MPPLEIQLALRAIIDHELRTFPVRDGLTIGSEACCDIQLPDALPRHVIIRGGTLSPRLCPADPAIKLRDDNGEELAYLPMRNGSTFVAGNTFFDCVQLPPEALFETDDPSEILRDACPRCRKALSTLDLSAKFCPHCGGPLPTDCPPWPVLPVETAPEEVKSRWTRWLPRWMRRRVDPLFFGRRTTVLAYINTLFNLGLRYESGVDRQRNLPQALRYYRKAARLGNLPARVRMHVKEAETHP